MGSRQDVEFKSLDGITLRGWLFPAAKKGPAVIITPGFNMTKEMVAIEVAEHFHACGFTVLSYDVRSVGASDGMPRNETDPVKNISDYSDALTFLKSQPMVDGKKIAFWGYSFSATVVLCAAALDKRAAAVVAVSPLTEWVFEKWTAVLKKAMKDRESRLAGNAPVEVPMLTPEGKNPAGWGIGGAFDDQEGVYDMILRAIEVEPSFIPNTTLGSYYNIAAFSPLPLMDKVKGTPAMLVTAEQDQISTPTMQRERVLDVLSEPKRMLIVPGRGHMNVLSGENAGKVLDEQVAFLREHLK